VTCSIAPPSPSARTGQTSCAAPSSRKRIPWNREWAPRLLPPKLCGRSWVLRHSIRGCGLEPGLIYPVKVQASQINGCAFDLGMHGHDARQGSETEQRLSLRDAWREVAFYSPRERAGWPGTKALTRIAETNAPDDEYFELRRHFSEREVVDLSTRGPC
jgi:AhpD family alkylhydroperoxidase